MRYEDRLVRYVDFIAGLAMKSPVALKEATRRAQKAQRDEFGSKLNIRGKRSWIFEQICTRNVKMTRHEVIYCDCSPLRQYPRSDWSVLLGPCEHPDCD